MLGNSLFGSISTWTFRHSLPPHWAMIPVYLLVSPGRGIPYSSELIAAATKVLHICTMSGIVIGAPSAVGPPLLFCPLPPGAPGAPADPFDPGAAGTFPPPVAAGPPEAL